MVEVYNALDSAARTAFTIVLLLWLISSGSHFETEYNPKLVEMYKFPWWRMLVGLLLVAASVWCPRVGIMAAMVVFFYFMDLETLTFT